MKTQYEIVDQVHRQAQVAAKKFKASEVELLNALQQCDRHRVFVVLGYSSLFAYATQNLGLSEDVACSYINVARKSREVPALKAAIEKGDITVSKAGRLTKVLTKVNQEHWLALAKISSKRKLEKHIAIENPKAAVVEKINYVSGNRVAMQVGVSEELMIRLRRAQDVISQKRRRSVSLEEVLEVICADYLRCNDPLEIAERQLAKGKLQNSFSQQSQQLSGPGRPGERRPISSAIKQKVLLKFNGQCAYHQTDGRRCEQRRFLDIHHVVPVAHGGTNDLGNLEILCHRHHRERHKWTIGAKRSHSYTQA